MNPEDSRVTAMNYDTDTVSEQKVVTKMNNLLAQDQILWPQGAPPREAHYKLRESLTLLISVGKLCLYRRPSSVSTKAYRTEKPSTAG